MIARVDYWPESHCLHEYLDNHAQVMQAIESRLPAGVALIGSDYNGSQVEVRVEHGRAAAQKIVAHLT